MEEFEKKQDSISELETKLDEFLSEDFEVCSEKPIFKEETPNLSLQTEPKKTDQGVSVDNDPVNAENKFRELKIKKELEALKTKQKNNQNREKPQESLHEEYSISDEDLSLSINSFLSKINNSK